MINLIHYSSFMHRIMKLEIIIAISYKMKIWISLEFNILELKEKKANIMESNNEELMNNLDSQPTISNPENVNSHIIKPMNKKILTLIYCIIFWNFGLCVAIFGPTLLDLACQTSSTLSAMSILYFLQNFTSLIGVFVSGMILKKKR